MILSVSLEDLIRSSTILGKKTNKGYEVLKCKICNDYKDRAGFNFQDGFIKYSCFNCSYFAKYEQDSIHISGKMKKVLESVGIQEQQYQPIVSSGFFKSKNPTQELKKIQINFPKSCDLPKNCRLLSVDDDYIWSQIAVEYLRSRNIELSNNFYISESELYTGRLIISCKFKGNVIWWQGRALDESVEPRYKNTTVHKDNVFYNMDEVYRYTNEPLFVSEGWTDAVTFGRNGVALMGSTLSEFKLEALRKCSNRKIIFIIDKNIPGYKLGSIVLQNNWSICVFPNSIDDANKSLLEMGKIWTVNYVLTNSFDGLNGKLILENMKREIS